MIIENRARTYTRTSEPSGTTQGLHHHTGSGLSSCPKETRPNGGGRSPPDGSGFPDKHNLTSRRLRIRSVGILCAVVEVPRSLSQDLPCPHLSRERRARGWLPPHSRSSSAMPRQPKNMPTFWSRKPNPRGPLKCRSNRIRFRRPRSRTRLRPSPHPRPRPCPRHRPP